MTSFYLGYERRQHKEIDVQDTEKVLSINIDVFNKNNLYVMCAVQVFPGLVYQEGAGTSVH